jgi:hypothetical protein
MTTALPSRDFRWASKKPPWPEFHELPRPATANERRRFTGDEAIHFSDRLKSTFQQRQFTRMTMDKHHKLVRSARTRMREETHLSKHQYRVMDYYANQRRVRDNSEKHVPRTMKTGMSAIALHGWQAGLQAHQRRKARAVPTLSPWIDNHLQSGRDYANKRRARAKAVDKPPGARPSLTRRGAKTVDQLHAEIMGAWAAVPGGRAAPRRPFEAGRGPPARRRPASAPARRRAAASPANWSRDILDGAFAEAMRARDEASKTSKT